MSDTVKQALSILNDEPIFVLAKFFLLSICSLMLHPMFGFLLRTDWLPFFRTTCLVIVVALFTGAAVPALAQVTVTTIDDTDATDTVCSLREAIEATNAGSDQSGGDCPDGGGTFDTIAFNIGSGCDGTTNVCTITLGGDLPDLTAGNVTVDGYTQPGASANTQAVGTDAVLLIEVDGTAATSCFVLDSASNTLRGMAIINCTEAGVLVVDDGNVMTGNYIGVAADGTTAGGNGIDGVAIIEASSNRIGTDGDGTGDAGERNVIANNVENGIYVEEGLATGNVIAGNYIGVAADGATGAGNGGDGIFLFGAPSNIIGTDGDGSTGDANEGNVISSNGFGGISVIDEDAAAMPVGQKFQTRRHTRVSRKTTQNQRRVDTASRQTRVRVAKSAGYASAGRAGKTWVASGNVIAGNLIGVDAAGTTGLSNVDEGIYLVEATNTRIGTNGDGTSDVAERNVISGNDFDGIGIYGGSGNTIAGNYIGTDVTGAAALGNAVDGVYMVQSPSNIIGTNSDGSAGEANEGNVISDNGDNGVLIEGPASTGNVIAGNLIGTNAAGSAGFGNSDDGIEIFEANSIRIGTDGDGTNDAGERNVISDNDFGVYISNEDPDDGIFAFNITVAGNYIGTDINGAVGLGNAEDGIQIDEAPNNIIGTNSDGSAGEANEGNVISDNEDGIVIDGAASTGNVIAGNVIGLNAVGTDGLGNSSGGVEIVDAPGNRVGTDGDGTNDTGERNVISDNDSGVDIVNSDAAIAILAQNNIVAGNYIGTNAAGTVGIGNFLGVFVDDAPSNVIGTNSDGSTGEANEGNVISDNEFGVVIFDDASIGNVIAGNIIGLAADGAAAMGNGEEGVVLDASSGTRVGTDGDGTNDAGERNVISSNGDDGVELTAGASGNTIAGNYIGVAANGTTPRGNVDDGVDVAEGSNTVIGSTTENTAETNIIAYNGNNGVEVTDTSTGIQVVFNSIFFNGFIEGGLGIDLSVTDAPDGATPNDSDPDDPDGGPNDLQNFPDISRSEVLANGNVFVIYDVDSDPTNSVYPLRIDFYRAGTLGQGQDWLGSDTYTASDYAGTAAANKVMAGSEKSVVFTPPTLSPELLPTDNIVATATDANGNTSEFMSTPQLLPVELVAFDALVDGATVRLEWATASETNNAGFEVQRQVETDDVESWDMVGFVDGNGTTLEPQAYAFSLENLTPGVHYFRLRQVDFDGAFEYSPTLEVAVELAGRFHLSEVYPNPFNPEATVTFSTAVAMPVQLTLYDLLGRAVQVLYTGTTTAQQTQTVHIDGSGLATGTYLLRLEGDGLAETRRVLLMK